MRAWCRGLRYCPDLLGIVTAEQLDNLEFDEGGHIMKKFLSIALLVAMSLLFIVSLSFCIYSFYDLNRVLGELANDPSASGIDYFGLGWGYGICLFALSIIGLIISVINKKVQQLQVLENISLGAILAFVLFMVLSVLLFCR